MTAQDFDWTVRGGDWPPQGRPSPPYGPTFVEVMRSCPIRAFFERSSGYERRMTFDARVGTAFHHVMESLVKRPLSGSAADVAEGVRQRFAHALREQAVQVAQRPRERGLPRSTVRAQLAVEALMMAAQRGTGAARSPHGGHGTGTWTPKPGDVEVEVAVRSADGLLGGRIDRAEHTAEGVVLYDYKSAVRDNLPGRYARQVQLYAALWAEVRGVWPVRGVVVYPLTGTQHSVDLRPDVCLSTLEETRALIRQVEQASDPAPLAEPGDVCKICEFRPWCAPFWVWQADERSALVARERASWGMEGRVQEVKVIDRHSVLRLCWRDATVQLVAPQERFPHLHRCHAGDTLRLLGMQLTGTLASSRATVRDDSEVFFVA